MTTEFKSFDILKGMERTGGGLERFLEMTQFFTSYIDQLVEPLQQGIEQEDRHAAQKAAHKIKGSLGMVGAKEAFDIAKELELRALDFSQEAIANQMQRFMQELTTLKAELQAFAKEQHEG